MRKRCIFLLLVLLAAAAPAAGGSYYDDWEYDYDPREDEWEWGYEHDEAFSDQWAREYQPLQDEFEWEYREYDYDDETYEGRGPDWSEYEWEPSEGLHREEWYDATDDWTDADERVGYADDAWGEDRNGEGLSNEYDVDDRRQIGSREDKLEEGEGEREREYEPYESFYTEGWFEAENAFSDWYEED